MRTLDEQMELHVLALASLLVEHLSQLHVEVSESKRLRLRLAIDDILLELQRAKAHLT